MKHPTPCVIRGWIANKKTQKYGIRPIRKELTKSERIKDKYYMRKIAKQKKNYEKQNE